MPDRRPFFSCDFDPLRVCTTIALLAVLMGLSTAIFWRGWIARQDLEPSHVVQGEELREQIEEMRRILAEHDRLHPPDPEMIR